MNKTARMVAESDTLKSWKLVVRIICWYHQEQVALRSSALPDSTGTFIAFSSAVHERSFKFFVNGQCIRRCSPGFRSGRPLCLPLGHGGYHSSS
mmetsp:Transcript_51193/g.84967  ORF Transcript_51193/g.84967 Transcript_51193/m.84967 type:complete len:94 (-) Transcript_51193:164-445(-)